MQLLTFVGHDLCLDEHSVIAQRHFSGRAIEPHIPNFAICERKFAQNERIGQRTGKNHLAIENTPHI